MPDYKSVVVSTTDKKKNKKKKKENAALAIVKGLSLIHISEPTRH